MNNAIKYTSIECLKYAHENGCQLEIKMLDKAVYSGSIDCLKYLHKICKLPLNYNICTLAMCKNGHLQCLKYLLENSCHFNTNTF